MNKLAEVIEKMYPKYMMMKINVPCKGKYEYSQEAILKYCLELACASVR